jgi:hypothetical protein
MSDTQDGGSGVVPSIATCRPNTAPGLRQGETMRSSMPETRVLSLDIEPTRPRTRPQDGFQKEKFIDGTIRYGCSATIDEPRDLSAALTNINWKVAMDDEFNALIKKQYLTSCTAKQSKECDRLQMGLQGKKES